MRHFRGIPVALAIATTHIFALSAGNSSIGHLDPECPTGLHPGFEVSTFRYNVPAQNFFDATGSFFQGEWYSIVNLTTNGVDNTIGATREANFTGDFFKEELVQFYRSSTELVIAYKLISPPFHFSDPFPDFTAAYTEEYRVMSICAGSATFISFVSVICTDKPAVAYDTYYRYHQQVFSGFATQFNASMFDGTCPLSVEAL
ncbi:hypothetical protein HYPSUDRAFT_42057 [Hypholoma sublateritium FD-334 SS-4]|uniref:Lipocalin/cytosolic fatty-acid binding domain-containing protein n=1 Tax=Hypholoma sublateritium (strain FD-334 SS-4) TaxID=945553 RepID=A0A0D2PND1_HYPSF|nr:hypothetical protein HYPSUDRAFT_42057 [Hypholoma sublateritium FD-334 SS-4]